MTRPRGLFRLIGWLAGGALVVGALALGCSYSPDFRNGALKCSPDGQCPRGYSCLGQMCCLSGDSTCGGLIPPPDASVPTDGSVSHFDVHPPGTGGRTATGTGGVMGAGGAPVGSADVTAYLGTWTFASTSTLDTECQGANGSGGPVPFLTKTNATSTITITNNGDGTLQAVWSEWSGCTYTLSVDGSGAHGTDADTWACEYTYDPTVTSPPQLSDQLWIYDTFDIVTADGHTATHDGLYYRQDTYNDGSYVYCTQTLHAPMTK